MNNCLIKIITITLFISIILFSINSNGSDYSSSKDYTRTTFSEFLYHRLKESGFFIPEKIEEYLSILPSYPNTNFKVINEMYLNESGSKVPARIFSSISIHGKIIADYTTSTAKRVLLDTVLTEAVTNKYNEALELFYSYIQGLRYGIPSGYFDSYRIIGIKQLDLPPSMELKYRVKPILLAIFIGLSDGVWVKGPMYIYYFAFETSGTSFEGTYSRIVIILSIVIDENHVLYADAPSAFGVVHYYSLATYSPTGSGYPIATIYGVIGVLLALGIMFIEYDEEYKYYLTIFFLFIIQLFSFLAICAAVGVPIDKVFSIILSLGPWFSILALLWIPPYVFSTYKFYLMSESKSTPTYSTAIFEGLVLAIVSVILILLIVFIRPITEYLVTVSGPGAVYIIVVALTSIDVYIGYSIGKLWATFGRYATSYY